MKGWRGQNVAELLAVDIEIPAKDYFWYSMNGFCQALYIVRLTNDETSIVSR